MKYFLLELKKLFALPSYRYLFMVIVVVTSFMNFIPLFRDESNVSWANSFADSFGIIIFLTTIGMIITTAQFISGEYLNRTVQMSLAAGVSRHKFIISKCWALVKGTYIMLIATALVSLIIAAIVTMLLGKFNLNHLSFPHLFASFVFSPLKILPLVMITFFMTVLMRTSIFPIAFLMIYSTIGELLLSALLNRSPIAKALDYLPGRIGEAIDGFTTNGLSIYRNQAMIERTAREATMYALSGFESVTGIIFYVIIFTALSFLIFRKQDLSR